MTFTAKIDGISLENLKYKWVVSNGEIANGQGTLTINVVATKEMNGQTVTATIEVSGLPKNCPNEFYSWGEIEALPLPKSSDNYIQYGKISWQKEQSMLDNVAKRLIEERDLTALFRILLITKRPLQTFKIKSAKIKTYLITKHKIAKDRIKFVFGGNEDNWTAMFFVPDGVKMPS